MRRRRSIATQPRLGRDDRLLGAHLDQPGEAGGEVLGVGELVADGLLGLGDVRGDDRGLRPQPGAHRLAVGVEQRRDAERRAGAAIRSRVDGRSRRPAAASRRSRRSRRRRRGRAAARRSARGRPRPTCGPRSLISVCSPEVGSTIERFVRESPRDLDEVVEDLLGVEQLADPRAGRPAGQPGGDHRLAEALQRARDVDALAAGGRPRVDRAVAVAERDAGHRDRPVERDVQRDREDHSSLPCVSLLVAAPRVSSSLLCAALVAAGASCGGAQERSHEQYDDQHDDRPRRRRPARRSGRRTSARRSRAAAISGTRPTGSPSSSDGRPAEPLAALDRALDLARRVDVGLAGPGRRGPGPRAPRLATQLRAARPRSARPPPRARSPAANGAARARRASSRSRGARSVSASRAASLGGAEDDREQRHALRASPRRRGRSPASSVWPVLTPSTLGSASSRVLRVTTVRATAPLSSVASGMVDDLAEPLVLAQRQRQLGEVARRSSSCPGRRGRSGSRSWCRRGRARPAARFICADERVLASRRRPRRRSRRRRWRSAASSP